jgi:glycosyltransferase involved in cell wall biosynthesis
MHGLMEAMARRHRISAISLIDPSEDEAAVRDAMGGYAEDLVLVRARAGGTGILKRALQVRSLLSRRSYEHLLYGAPALGATLAAVLARRRFDVVTVEFPYLAHFLSAMPRTGSADPIRVLDEHNVEYEVVRQVAEGDVGAWRRFYGRRNWLKLREEEIATWKGFDGVTVTSRNDEATVLAGAPAARTAVVPNAVDVERFRPRPTDVPPDGRTLLFFGAINYYPNTDGVLWFLREIWPRIQAVRPGARVLVVGQRPPPAVLDLRSPSVDVVGFVDDLRPVIARAAVVIVPLRMGSGTRLKIVEAMAMSKAIVSTRVGAEGLDVRDGKHLVLADEPGKFADACLRVMDDSGFATSLGRDARSLVEAEYSWDAAARRLEAFLLRLVREKAGG